MQWEPKPWSSADRELVHGERVIIAARWILVVAGLALALWNPAGLVQLQIAIVVILGLAVGNFALQMNMITKGSLLSPIVYAASVADLVAISLLIAAAESIPAEAYVFYLPALLAVSVTFPPLATAGYTLGAMVTYGAIAVATAPPTLEAGLTIAIELLILAAVPICGHVYWRLERDRRARAARHNPATSTRLPAAGGR